MKGLIAVAALLASSVTSAPAAVPAPKPGPAAAPVAKPASPPAPAVAVSFSRDIVPVLRTQCATCHMTGQEPGNMALHPGAAYATLVNVKSPVSGLVRVVPGKPEQSYLLMKLQGTHLDHGGKGVRMPFSLPPLPQKVIDQIAAWISQGAKNN
ncbi:MAG: hypothetical protein U1F14_10200 [Steroidobacteraceae bacterium]